MSKRADHHRLNKAKTPKPRVRGKNSVGVPASAVKNIHRSTFEGQCAWRLARVHLIDINKDREDRLTAKENARLQATLAEFAWQELE